ncbi:hypothetical protein GIB67_009809 [Kingdonia uniflora]|uniref:TF-B3 domain-containing protein n=1 Tax=Kingdonia uniflora TaxID=39325 RepID=A0A7J7MGS2_9MAGN|nr:hypothetical protein GIB67_009809 [Kingdonia uniflora]
MKDSSIRDGWKDFARDHDLHIRDFVVFKHVGNLIFDVMVFDTTYCERNYPSRFDLENDDSRLRVTKNNEKQGGKMKIKKGVEVPYFKTTSMRYNFSQNTMVSFSHMLNCEYQSFRIVSNKLSVNAEYTISFCKV